MREVWLFKDGSFRVFVLGTKGYEVAPTSSVFPEVDLERLAHYALQPDQHEALRAFRRELSGR